MSQMSHKAPIKDQPTAETFRNLNLALGQALKTRKARARPASHIADKYCLQRSSVEERKQSIPRCADAIQGVIDWAKIRMGVTSDPSRRCTVQNARFGVRASRSGDREQVLRE